MCQADGGTHRTCASCSVSLTPCRLAELDAMMGAARELLTKQASVLQMNARRKILRQASRRIAASPLLALVAPLPTTPPPPHRPLLLTSPQDVTTDTLLVRLSPPSTHKTATATLLHAHTHAHAHTHTHVPIHPPTHPHPTAGHHQHQDGDPAGCGGSPGLGGRRCGPASEAGQHRCERGSDGDIQP